MKTIHSEVTIKIPSDVTIDINARCVTVKGPLGVLVKDFKHQSIEIIHKGKDVVSVGVWFGVRKHLACVRTICSHINNMIKGVTKGFSYKMKAVYKHFPIKMLVGDKKEFIEIRNFLGEKLVRRVDMPQGVIVDTTKEKDEIKISGTSVEKVSATAALIQQMCAAKNKDVRKFLDGVYVSERGVQC